MSGLGGSIIEGIEPGKGREGVREEGRQWGKGSHTEPQFLGLESPTDFYI